MRPSDRINDRGGFFHVAVFADGCEELCGPQKLVPGNSGDPLHHFRCVARIVFFQKLENAIRILQRQVDFGFFRQRRRDRRISAARVCASGTTAGIIPGRLVVGFCLFIEARENSLVFRQFETGLYDKRRVRVVHQVIVRQPVIFNRITDRAAQKRNVRARANLAEKIGHR